MSAMSTKLWRLPFGPRAALGALPLLLAVASAIACYPAAAATFSGVEYARPGGVSLRFDARIPDSAGPFPAVVWVHGGGFTSGDRTAYPHGLADDLLARGAAWFSIDYRLAPRYPFPAPTSDVESAIHFIKTHASNFHVDPKRLALMGESAGGLLVSFAGANHRPQDSVAAVVSFYGEHDLVHRVHTLEGCVMDGKIIPNPHPGKPQDCLSPGLAAYLGIKGLTPGAEALIRKASPATYANRRMPPYLLLHGTADLYVPFQQSRLMCDAMTAAGAKCTLYAVPGGSHGMDGWDRDSSQAAYKPFLLFWLAKRLGMQEAN